MVNDRHLELSSKLIEMGKALMLEGHDNKDLVISQAGASLIAMGGLMLDGKTMFLFSQMCGLFSSKMVLDTMENQKNKLKKNNLDSYQDFINRINKIRKENGEEPLNLDS